MLVSQFWLWLSRLLKAKQCVVCACPLPTFGTCTDCLKSVTFPVLQASQFCRVLPCAVLTASPLRVWVATPWSASVKTVLYQYKFLKRYEHTPLLVAILQRLAEFVILQCVGVMGSSTEIVVTHPPARAGRVYPWQRVVARLAAQQGWVYQPQLLQWQKQIQQQKMASSKQVRQQQSAGALQVNPQGLLGRFQVKPPRVLLVLDDILTTGSTLLACTEALEQLLQQQGWQETTSIICIALTDVPL
jgi:predicted amidophosphoribosyltransferase